MLKCNFHAHLYIHNHLKLIRCMHVLLHTYIHRNGVSFLIISQTSNFHIILLQSLDKTALWIGKKEFRFMPGDSIHRLFFLPFNAACQIGLFPLVPQYDYVIVFQLRHKEHPQSAIRFSPPTTQIRVKGKLLSDKFFSTFLNDAALSLRHF